MKHLTLIIITLFVFQMNHAQNNNYSKLWKQVETFENEGLPKSALKIVEDLETLAKKENQDKPESCIYKSTINSEEEKGNTTNPQVFSCSSFNKVSGF